MARKSKEAAAAALDDDGSAAGETIDGDSEDIVLEGTLVCALTGEHKTATPQEATLQSFIEQRHRE